MLVWTAVLKLWLLLTDPFADLNVGLSKEIIFAAIVLELIVGYFNFRHINQRRIALLNVIVFSFFGFFSLAKWYLGSGYCACAGVIRLPIWIFITIDFVLASIFFLLFRLNQLRRAELGFYEMRRALARCASPGTTVAVVFFVLFLGWQHFLGLAWFRSTRFGEQPIKVRLKMPERLRVSQESTGEVEFHNQSTTDAKIVGLDVSCRCFELDEPIGLVIAANSIRKIDFRIVPMKQGEVRQRAVLFLDHPEQFQMTLDLVGSAKER